MRGAPDDVWPRTVILSWWHQPYHWQWPPPDSTCIRPRLYITPTATRAILEMGIEPNRTNPKSCWVRFPSLSYIRYCRSAGAEQSAVSATTKYDAMHSQSINQSILYWNEKQTNRCQNSIELAYGRWNVKIQHTNDTIRKVAFIKKRSLSVDCWYSCVSELEWSSAFLF